MPVNQALLDSITTSLGPAIAPSLTTADAACDLFEAYVFSVVLDAAIIAGATVRLFDRYRTVSTVFRFRVGPGHIFQTSSNYSYAEIEFPQKPKLEVHQGIMVVGTSKVLHEADVVVLDGNAAETCRQKNADPGRKHLILSSECKMYQAASLGIRHAREFYGLAADLRKKRAVVFVSNTTSTNLITYLTYHRKGFFLGVMPTNAIAQAQLRSAFEVIFNQYKL